MLYFRLGHGVDLAVALSTYTTGLFPTFENRDSEMIQWAVNEAWEYPAIPNALRHFLKHEVILATTRCGIKQLGVNQ